MNYLSSPTLEGPFLPKPEDQTLESLEIESLSDSVRRIGPYRLGERLGDGGMGTVYRGFHELLERHVALKRLRPDQSISEVSRKRFLREAQAAARLNHPSVAQIYDIFQHEGDAWIAMELVDGAPLSEVVKDDPLPWPKVVEIGRAVAVALEAAHAVAILHRDLKTENVILSKTGEVKVVDFGLAKELGFQEDQAPQSLTRGLAGTPRCLSPEQAMSQPLDYRSDLFSFGVLLYELLTTRSPFHGPTLLAMLNNVCTEPHVPVQAIDPSVPRDLSDLIDDLLQKLPEKRPPDAQAVGEILRGIEFRHSGVLPSGSRVGSIRNPPRRSGDFMSDRRTVPGRTVPGRTVPGRTEPGRSSSRAFDTVGLEERRHVIVVSCELSAEDPEDLHEALPQLQGRIKSLVGSRRGCFIETPGARLVVCLGYPQAFEDDAVSAVSIAQAMLSEVQSFAASVDGIAVQGRCGLHVGIAFTPAEADGGQPELGSILDQTIEVARSADAGRLLTTAKARPLLPSSIQVSELADPSRSESLFEIRLESEVQSLESYWPVGSLTPPIGRETEIRLLQDTFQSVAEGSFRVVQVCGEGGIGKTKLLAGLRAELGRERFQWITLVGSPETANSPFFPISTLLSHFFDLSPEMPIDQQVSDLQDRVEALDLDLNLADEDFLPCLAPHLSPTLEDFYPEPALSPEARKRRVLEALTSLLAAAGDRTPIILVVEDLHWLDPSSLEWITQLIEERAVPSLFLVLTFRPHFVPPWGHRPDIIQLNLHPLSKEPTRALISHIFGRRELPTEIVEQIIAKADGVPLFLEQLARTVLEAGDSGEVEIPATLRGSLMARLDQLGPAKTVAQYASVVGRELPLPVLQAISPFDEHSLDLELRHLIDAGILFRRGAGQRIRYVFKHALIRDAAYESLMKKDRRKLHREIVQALEQSCARLVRRNPELLAQHCTLGGLTQRAVEQWSRAAFEALARSANIEAISHAEKGLELLGSLPGSEERSAHELDLRVSLVQALTAAKGYAAPKLHDSFRRIEELARDTGDGPRVTIALRGLFHLAHYSGESALKLEYCDRFLEHAKALADRLLMMEAHFQSGLTFFSLGDLREARRHLEEGLAIEGHLGDDDGDVEARTVGHGKAAVSGSILALTLWISGYPDRAAALIREILRFPRELDPLSRVLARHNASGIFFEMGAYGEARDNALGAIEMSQENELFTQLRSRAMLDLVELRSAEGPRSTSESKARLQATIAELSSGGASFGLSFFLCRLAEVHLAQKEPAEADEQLKVAGGLIEALDERLWLPEMLRIRGELLCEMGRPQEAEQMLGQALEVARDQGAKSFELRTALSLARLGATGPQADVAKQCLREVYDRFDEGFATRELEIAQKLLQVEAS